MISEQDLPIEISAVVLANRPAPEQEPDETNDHFNITPDLVTPPPPTAAGAVDPDQRFRTLSLETDLNVAPANWLRGDMSARG